MRLFLLFSLSLAACGHRDHAGDPELSIAASLPTLQDLPGLSCGDWHTLDSMRATLYVADQPSCPLQWDTGTLAPTAGCETFETGESHPLFIEYEMPAAMGDPSLLAVAYGTLDLQDENVAPYDGEKNVPIEALMSCPWMVLYRDADLASLPAADAEVEGACPEAALWAQVGGNQASSWAFDDDTDGCTNLAEACAETLFLDDDC